jgi:hypothetical protein
VKQYLFFILCLSFPIKSYRSFKSSENTQQIAVLAPGTLFSLRFLIFLKIISRKNLSLTIGSTETKSSAKAPAPFRRLYFERCLQKTLTRSTFKFFFMIKLKSYIFENFFTNSRHFMFHLKKNILKTRLIQPCDTTLWYAPRNICLSQ